MMTMDDAQDKTITSNHTPLIDNYNMMGDDATQSSQNTRKLLQNIDNLTMVKNGFLQSFL